MTAVAEQMELNYDKTYFATCQPYISRSGTPGENIQIEDFGRGERG
jgi:hypothetical protein